MPRPGYDAAGNLKELPDRTDPTKCERYSYDYRNRLIKIEHSDDYDEETPTWSTVVQYEYDGLNRRVKKDLASGTDVVYLYDGWQMLEERELDGEAWEARRQFVYGGLYIDEPVAFDKDTDSDGDCTEGNGGSSRYLYAQQANFNVVALTDSAGAAVETVKYDPYGEPTCRRVSDGHEQASSHIENALLFTGHRYDSESGLYYARNRYYHPALGRWLSRDRLGYLDGMGLYEYVGSSPVRRVDPYGNVWYKPWTWFDKDEEEPEPEERAAKGAAQAAAEAAQEAAKNYSEDGKLNPAKDVTPTSGERLRSLANSAGWTVVDALKGGLEAFAKSDSCNQWYGKADKAIRAAKDPKTLCNPCSVIVTGTVKTDEGIAPQQKAGMGIAGRCQTDILLGTGGYLPGVTASRVFAAFAENLYKKCCELYEKSHPGAQK